MEALLAKLEGYADKDTLFVLAGSVPCPQDFLPFGKVPVPMQYNPFLHIALIQSDLVL